MLLEQKGPITLPFFFKEVVNVRLLLLYQLFKKLTIFDVRPLLMTTTDAIADPPFELIGARMDATEEMMNALTSNYFWSHQV